MVGPSQQTAKYPRLFASGHGPFGDLLEEFPYLLPNLIAVLLSSITVIVCYIYLTENKEQNYHILKVDESEEGIELEDMAGNSSSEEDTEREASSSIETEPDSGISGVSVSAYDEEFRLKPFVEDSGTEKMGNYFSLLVNRYAPSLWCNQRQRGKQAKKTQSVFLDKGVLLTTNLYALTGLVYILIDAVSCSPQQKE